MNENVLEFLRNEETMTVTFSQGRFISLVKKLQKQNPDEVEIVAENPDGSIVAHIPVRYLHLSNRSRNLTEEQREILSERAKTNFKNN